MWHGGLLLGRDDKGDVWVGGTPVSIDECAAGLAAGVKHKRASRVAARCLTPSAKPARGAFIESMGWCGVARGNDGVPHARERNQFRASHRRIYAGTAMTILAISFRILPQQHA